MCVSTCVNHTAYSGAKGAVPDMGWPISVVCLLGLITNQVAVNHAVYGRNFKLYQARTQLRRR